MCGKGNATTFRRLRYCRAVLSVPGDGGGGALPRPRVAYGPWRVAALASGAECGGGRQAGSGAGERASSPGDLECKTRAILIHPCAVVRGGMGRGAGAGAGASSGGVRRKRETAFCWLRVRLLLVLASARETRGMEWAEPSRNEMNTAAVHLTVYFTAAHRRRTATANCWPALTKAPLRSQSRIAISMVTALYQKRSGNSLLIQRINRVA